MQASQIDLIEASFQGHEADVRLCVKHFPDRVNAPEERVRAVLCCATVLLCAVVAAPMCAVCCPYVCCVLCAVCRVLSVRWQSGHTPLIWASENGAFQGAIDHHYE